MSRTRVFTRRLLPLVLASPFALGAREEQRLSALRQSVEILQNRLEGLEREYEEERAELEVYLIYLDLTLGIQVVEGGMDEQAALDWLRQRLRHVFEHRNPPGELESAFQQWRQAALGFIERTEQRAATGSTWPPDQTPSAYRELAASMLRVQRDQMPERPSLRPGLSDAGLLAVVAEVRDWTRGTRQAGTPSEARNYFTGSADRVAALLRAEREARLAVSEDPSRPPYVPDGPPGPGKTTHPPVVLKDPVPPARIPEQEAAIALLHANRIPEALAAFRALAQARPGEDEVLRLWSLMEIVANGDVAAARRTADALAARHPGEAQYLLLQGQAALFSRDQATAIRCLSAAGQADPQLIQGVHQQANAMLQAGVVAVAYVQYSSLVWMQPPHSPSYFGLGFAAKGMGYLDVARDSFQRYLQQVDANSSFADQARRELQALGGK